MKTSTFTIKGITPLLMHNTQLRFEQASKQRIRDFRKMQQIDRGQLCTMSQNTMDRKVVELGRRVQADKKARKEAFDYAPVERNTPSRIKSEAG